MQSAIDILEKKKNTKKTKTSRTLWSNYEDLLSYEKHEKTSSKNC